MRLFPPDTRQWRAHLTLFTIAFVVAVLLTAFFETQVLSKDVYTLRSEDNRLRPVVIPAARGIIYDRFGEVVATSVPSFRVLLMPGESETIRRTLTELAPFLGLAGAEIDRLVKERAARPHDLLTVVQNATFVQVAALEERRAAFPNVMVVAWPRRYYPAGAALGHLVGYVSEISEKELGLPLYQQAGYRQGRWIGKAGIEKEYEMRLSGQDGARFVEVSAMGRIVNPRAPARVEPPIPGEDLRITLDLKLQRYVRQIFPDTMKGAVVAMVPSTGEILALYSNPSYDPNAFVGGIRSTLWSALNNDPDKPLLDRAIYAQYPPSSTFKLATAVIGVQMGLAKADTHMPIPCSGGWEYGGRYFRCWKASGHGSLDLTSAIEKSCNVYFYQLGVLIGLREFTARGTRMGFNRKSGIDLPGESAPVFPTGPEWYRSRNRYMAPSLVMSLAIGQGENSQTVLKMAHFYSAIAGNGTAPEPHLLAGAGAGDGPGAIDLGLTPEELREIWPGLAAVVRSGGTGWLSALQRWHIYGKTGTAQNPPNADHGWFVGFSGKPGGSPEIVVAVIVEHGLHGSDVSPLAAKVIDYYLNRKHGFPFDPQPTLIERYESRRKAWGSLDEYPAPLVPAARH